MNRKRYGFGKGRCYLCGTICVPAVDNCGQPYMGCPCCVIIDPTKAKSR